MARRGGSTVFLVVAVGLGYLAYTLLRPRAAGPATHQDGTVGGGVTGSPHQVTYYSGGATGLQTFAKQAAASWFGPIG